MFRIERIYYSKSTFETLVRITQHHKTVDLGLGKANNDFLMPITQLKWLNLPNLLKGYESNTGFKVPNLKRGDNCVTTSQWDVSFHWDVEEYVSDSLWNTYRTTLTNSTLEALAILLIETIATEYYNLPKPYRSSVTNYVSEIANDTGSADNPFDIRLEKGTIPDKLEYANKVFFEGQQLQGNLQFAFSFARPKNQLETKELLRKVKKQVTLLNKHLVRLGVYSDLKYTPSSRTKDRYYYTFKLQTLPKVISEPSNKPTNKQTKKDKKYFPFKPEYTEMSTLVYESTKLEYLSPEEYNRLVVEPIVSYLSYGSNFEKINDIMRYPKNVRESSTMQRIMSTSPLLTAQYENESKALKECK